MSEYMSERFWRICPIQYQNLCLNRCQIQWLEKMSDILSTCMSWNVMVGITRSKVIVFFCSGCPRHCRLCKLYPAALLPNILGFARHWPSKSSLPARRQSCSSPGMKPKRRNHWYSRWVDLPLESLIKFFFRRMLRRIPVKGDMDKGCRGFQQGSWFMRLGN